MELLACQRIEVDARRPTFADTGVRLLLHGVDWQIPSRGVRVRPVFGEDGAVTVYASVDDWPEATAIVERAEATIDGAVAYVQMGEELLGNVFALAARLLRVHYDLTDEQLGPLLELAGDTPIWVRQLLCWCHGASIDEAKPVYTEAELQAAVGTAIEQLDRKSVV